MKRTQLKRTGFSRRQRPMSSGAGKPSEKIESTQKKRKSPKRKTKYALRERDFAFMKFVKSLSCLLARDPDAGPCSSVVEADHAGVNKGMGQKAPDNTCIPLCSTHHLDRHACTGFFRGRDDETYAELKARKREWRLEAITKTQAEWCPKCNGLGEIHTQSMYDPADCNVFPCQKCMRYA